MILDMWIIYKVYKKCDGIYTSGLELDQQLHIINKKKKNR